ncbi:hypothetical protein D3C87_823390 [compost metagenome]
MQIDQPTVAVPLVGSLPTVGRCLGNETSCCREHILMESCMKLLVKKLLRTPSIPVRQRKQNLLVSLGLTC